MTLDPPRVLFVAPSAYPLGGVQTWLDYLLPGLAGLGWRPILGLVSGRFHDVGRYLAVHPWADTLTIANGTGSPEGRVRALIAAIGRVKPDLLVSVNIPDCFMAVERLRLRGRPSPRAVMTNHSVEAQYLADAKGWRDLIDGMIGTNRLTCRLAVECAGLAPARVHYAPYGVDLPLDPLRRRVTDGPLRIAYSGRLDEEQKRGGDLPLILEHLEATGVDYAFRLAGGGPSEAGLRAQLRARSESGRVRFLGVLDADTLNTELYDWADVLLVTSSWETGPIVIWEAMARGLPVVTSRYIGCGLESSLRDEDNCLIYPVGDTQAAAARLRRMTDPGLRTALADRGRALVAKRYTRPRSVAQWDRCLRAILDQPPQAPPRSSRVRQPAGRLDRWLGVSLGEHLRRLSGRTHQHVEPGGEWPHVNCMATPRSSEDLADFWAQAQHIDQIELGG